MMLMYPKQNKKEHDVEQIATDGRCLTQVHQTQELRFRLVAHKTEQCGLTPYRDGCQRE